jgi:hypothetical protein
MNIDTLIQQHLKWKSRVECLFNESNCNALNPAIYGRDTDCDLGKWIYSPATESLAHLEKFQQLKKAHKKFHLYAGSILMDFKSGKTVEAEARLPLFRKAAQDVIYLLTELKNEL